MLESSRYLHQHFFLFLLQLPLAGLLIVQLQPDCQCILVLHDIVDRAIEPLRIDFSFPLQVLPECVEMELIDVLDDDAVVFFLGLLYFLEAIGVNHSDWGVAS